MQSTKHITLLLYRRLRPIVLASGYEKYRLETALKSLEKFKWTIVK